MTMMADRENNVIRLSAREHADLSRFMHERIANAPAREHGADIPENVDLGLMEAFRRPAADAPRRAWRMAAAAAAAFVGAQAVAVALFYYLADPRGQAVAEQQAAEERDQLRERLDRIERQFASQPDYARETDNLTERVAELEGKVKSLELSSIGQLGGVLAAGTTPAEPSERDEVRRLLMELQLMQQEPLTDAPGNVQRFEYARQKRAIDRLDELRSFMSSEQRKEFLERQKRWLDAQSNAGSSLKSDKP